MIAKHQRLQVEQLSARTFRLRIARGYSIYDLAKAADEFAGTERVSTDKAYSAARILAQIESVGAQPLIPFKKNATGASPF